MRETGKYQSLGANNHFIPHPLPPSNPPLEITPELINLYGDASFALGQLNEMSLRLPNVTRFIKAYVIKEALLSSAIEGINTTLIEVFTHSLDSVNISKNTQSVLNYTYALELAVKLLTQEEMPVVNHVILAAHEALMSVGEGKKASPGAFRKQSVKVGNLVPPPANEIPQLMSSLEKYINEDLDTPPIIKAGLVHVHFETIHPFLDGNGRIGRLLIVLMLISNNILNLPILYPSYYFKKSHAEYYHRLDKVRTEGDFEGWIKYYLNIIKDSANDAYKRAKEIEKLEHNLKSFITNDEKFFRIRETAMLCLDFLFFQPIAGISEISQGIGKSYNTVSNVITQFIETNLVIENTNNKRNKVYKFQPYLEVLDKEY